MGQGTLGRYNTEWLTIQVDTQSFADIAVAPSLIQNQPKLPFQILLKLRDTIWDGELGTRLEHHCLPNVHFIELKSHGVCQLYRRGLTGHTLKTGPF